ncbi:MAG: SDR family NAD(P)-dependent oxidoreductase [Pseudomonadota bacterium]
MTGAAILTGVTSGFGALALEQLASEYDGDIIVGARRPEDVKRKFGDRVHATHLDLEQLSSADEFCQHVIEDLRLSEIACLGLNAGITSRKISMTDDGMGRVFQVNYLGHFLMFQRLQAHLSDTALIVTTGSGTHDPEENIPLPAPKHADARRLASPRTDPERDRFGPRAASRAYTSSKLCCILFAREMARRYPSYRTLSFDPAFLPETNLAREFPSFAAAIVKRMVPRAMPPDRTGTVATTAEAYAALFLGQLPLPENGGYLAMRSGKTRDVPPSKLARQKEVGIRLWDDSLALLEGRL